MGATTETSDKQWYSTDDFRVLAQPVKALAEDIENAWQIAPEKGLHDIIMETDPSLITGEGTDPVVNVEFELQSEGCVDLTLRLCYQLSLVERIFQGVRSGELKSK